MSTFTKQTRNRKVAAAIAPLGCPIKVEIIECDSTGVVDVAYHIHLDGPGMDRRAVGNLIKGLTDGTLETNTPHHAVLDGMRGILNCALLRDWKEKGNPYHLKQMDRRWVYHPGAHGVELAGSGNLVKSTDDWMAAALATVGIPIVNFDGAAWYFPERGLSPSTLPTADVIDSFRGKGHLAGLADDTVSWGYHAARIYDALTDRVNNDIRLYAITRPGGGSIGAVVRSDITGKGMDQVGRFFGA